MELEYHYFLDGIVAEDVDYVRRKDAQYNASWRQRGGVGAFFTIVRPLDRMMNMLDPTKVAGDRREAPIARTLNKPIAAYDILGALRAENDMSGVDGSLLACVRDLRRYLLLVEADLCEYNVKWIASQTLSALGGTTETIAERVTVFNETALMPALEPLVLTEGEDGYETFYAFPWRISKIEYMKMLEAHPGGDAWRQLLPTLYFLEASVAGATYKRLSPAVQSYYIKVEFETPAVTRVCYVLDLTNCPADIRMNYPIMSSEQNDKEHDGIPEEYRGMYDWHEVPSKWILRSEFFSWMKD